MCKQLVDKHALNTIDQGLISVLFPGAKILSALLDVPELLAFVHGHASNH